MVQRLFIYSNTYVLSLFSGNLTFTDPKNFIYVELNAILQANADVLADMFELLGNTNKKIYYSDIGARFQTGIDVVGDPFSSI